MIKTIAECDGPRCTVREIVSPALIGPGNWPGSWIVVNLLRNPGPLNQSIGTYGFHARACLTAWTES